MSSQERTGDLEQSPLPWGIKPKILGILPPCFLSHFLPFQFAISGHIRWMLQDDIVFQNAALEI